MFILKNIEILFTTTNWRISLLITITIIIIIIKKKKSLINIMIDKQ